MIHHRLDLKSLRRQHPNMFHIILICQGSLLHSLFFQLPFGPLLLILCFGVKNPSDPGGASADPGHCTHVLIWNNGFQRGITAWVRMNNHLVAASLDLSACSISIWRAEHSKGVDTNARSLLPALPQGALLLHHLVTIHFLVAKGGGPIQQAALLTVGIGKVIFTCEFLGSPQHSTAGSSVELLALSLQHRNVGHPTHIFLRHGVVNYTVPWVNSEWLILMMTASILLGTYRPSPIILFIQMLYQSQLYCFFNLKLIFVVKLL